MSAPSSPVIVAVTGWKNSGKTTFLVALAAELKRRGSRVASVKHGHHEFEVDEAGRDSWRHFHEGEVEAVMMIARGKIAIIARAVEEPDPETLIRRHFSDEGYDFVLVEGYKHGVFPKLEIHRVKVNASPIYDAADREAAARYLALITDQPINNVGCPIIRLDRTGSHVTSAADLLERLLESGNADAV
ncbi:molybdopterin-guanine dinucleotide biosynthesis protein B [soil metagenome]